MNKTTDFSSTIIALATALGSGSIAVIRMSGQDAISIAAKVFSGKNLLTVPANTIHYGRIISQNKVFDQVLVSIFHTPNSYTGENYVEISCHANPYIVDDIMAVLMDRGARIARAGEFTLRAFLNGKMDLSQAEAVASIIKAKSKIGVKNSLEQLNGKLAEKIMDTKQRLIEIIGSVEIELDFAEENLVTLTRKELLSQLYVLETQLKELTSSYNYAKLLEGGVQLTIIGEPNAGKSTLLNLILGENRAITSHIPGTTRDTIHENIVINDILFKLVDTAGLRESRDAIETEGIKRTQSQVSLADLILLVVDSRHTILKRSWNLIIETLHSTEAQIILVANKADLTLDQTTLKQLKSTGKSVVTISAKTGKGLKDLEKSIMDHISKGFKKYSEGLIITSKRQKEILDRTITHLRDACNLLKGNGGFEFAAVDLRQALDALAEITGETVTDDILNNVFDNFCIGK
jgi:tRNA modification GTPase